jgi:hypothetical protein
LASIKLPLKNIYTPIKQLPDILLTGPGKPYHLPHWHYLLWQRTLFCPIFGLVGPTHINEKKRAASLFD